MPLLACFGGPHTQADSSLPDSLVAREDSACGGGSSRRQSKIPGRSDSPSPPASRPWQSDGPAVLQRPSKPRIDRRLHDSDRRPDAAARKQHREQCHRRSVSVDQAPRSPNAPVSDPWLESKRLSFVGDISSRSGCTTTKLMQNRKTQELVDVKFLCRDCSVDGDTEAELLSHRRLHSPHVACFKEVFLTARHLAVVTDHAPGGPLFRHIVHSGRLPEPEARSLFRQLLAGIAHCHAQGVCHRDLRLESLRLDANGNLKIGDFAYAGSRPSGGDCQDSAHDTLHRRPASDARAAAAQVAFMPPEVVIGHHTGCDGEVLDLWACGVILYVMVFGRYPFDDSAATAGGGRRGGGERRMHGIVRNLCKVKYDFPRHVGASPEVCHLLSRVFVLPQKAARIDLGGMAAHPWVTDGGALPAVPIDGPPAGTPAAGTPVGVTSREPPLDLLTGDCSPTHSSVSSVQEPESPAESPCKSSGSVGNLNFFRRASRPQSEAEIAAVVQKALKGRR